MPDHKDRSQAAEGVKELVEEKETTETEKDGKKEDPADKLTEDHPRFQEVYGKWKSTERTTEQLKKLLEEKDLDLQLLRQHNQRLEEAIFSVSKKVDARNEEPAPNPIEEPEKYHQWWEKKYEEDRKQEHQTRYQERINEQIETQKEIHDDYESMVKPVMQEMETNSDLRARIWNSANPARAAYHYGKSKMKTQTKDFEEAGKEKEQERARAIEQGLVEGGSPPLPPQKKRRLTEEQARVARDLGVPEEKYLKQLEAMEGRK